ncbi:GNAT family N-acetyltransferase [Nonomuraea gerenzanensis]|uniref:Sortase and related acyltransferases n=1 Tax=Nonomuraea gerenzanensis TaxID=93944 RepID=A0A1M4ECH6_9ACTN|nr:GNAT family N-acetyltransferase [Nonomuraea gerenzanensis]UBU08295.1 GNAT family N-acetyltransferase [Nonomuraea gerenzanensis]SBO96625.1 Sortase and related acyltransferases [Nonomuraea gerenzanensis]
MSDDQHITLRPATPHDIPALLALMDSVLAWLVARGRTEQWGTVPFSRIPGFPELFTTWTAQGAITTAERATTCVGLLALAPTPPPRIPPSLIPDGALFIHTVMSARGPSGQGVGRALLEEAARQAESSGAPAVGLDHWAESAELDRIYEQHGFVKAGTCEETKDGRTTLNTVRVRHLSPAS